jgi:hypothetical protein
VGVSTPPLSTSDHRKVGHHVKIAGDALGAQGTAVASQQSQVEVKGTIL